MPLIAALAARHGFAGQRARAHRRHGDRRWSLSGEVVFAPDGGFAGFPGRADRPTATATPSRPSRRMAAIDQALDEALRSPLDRIIDCAERIVERADGPLRSDYAAYASDIAAAARHLLSVIRSMSEEPAQGAADDRSRRARRRSGGAARSRRPRRAGSRIAVEASQAAAGQRRRARGHPDPRQSDRQCGPPFARRRHGRPCASTRPPGPRR